MKTTGIYCSNIYGTFNTRVDTAMFSAVFPGDSRNSEERQAEKQREVLHKKVQERTNATLAQYQIINE